MHTRHMTRAIGALAVGAGLLASSACSETALTGFTDDSELQDSATVVFAALGVAREMNDLVFTEGGSAYVFSAATDEAVQDGLSAQERRNATGDWRQRNYDGYYEQAHEAIWASYKVIELARAQWTEEQLTNEPVIARSWLNAGFSERILGDWHCETVYQYGPFGGFNLAGLGDRDYDIGTIVGQDSIFKRMAYAMERAIEVSEAAIAQGIGADAADPVYFDPELIRLGAYAGLAEARAALASLGVDPQANWAAAAQAAAEVPLDFEELIPTDEQTRENDNWYWMGWLQDDVSGWGQIIEGQPYGSAAQYLADPGDPRVAVAKCGEFIVTTGTEEEIFNADNIQNNTSAGCGASFARGRGESDQVPLWAPLKFQEQFGPFRLTSGGQVRLIQAEAALEAGDLAGFTQLVNEVRAFHGLDPIDQPTSVGDFEFPNQVDDARSILDREVLLEGWLDGRRLFHLNRWDHPFITNNEWVIPRHREILAQGVQRGRCLPIPLDECNLNTAINCPEL